MHQPHYLARMLVGALLFLTLAFQPLSTQSLRGQDTKGQKKISLKWLGQSYFQITSADGTTIVTDPHGMPEYGRNMTKADIVTLSHLHEDHTMTDVVEGEPKVLYGLDPKDKKQNWVRINEKIKGVTIRTIPSFHDGSGGLQRGKNAIFHFEIDGLKVVHLGDLGHTLAAEQIKDIGAVDILLIPVGGVYTINGEKAKEVVKQLKPRLYIIPMHFGTRVLDSLLPPDEFLEGEENVRKVESNILEVPTDLKQDKPFIVVLSWK